MIRVTKDYDQRPGKIDFLATDNKYIVKWIKTALTEEAAHDARNDYYRGKLEDPDSVFKHLVDLYHYKCAFCESHLKNIICVFIFSCQPTDSSCLVRYQM